MDRDFKETLAPDDIEIITNQLQLNGIDARVQPVVNKLRDTVAWLNDLSDVLAYSGVDVEFLLDNHTNHRTGATYQTMRAVMAVKKRISGRG